MNDATDVLLIIAGVFGLLGIVFLAVGMIRRRMLRGWTRATGQVVPSGPLGRAGLAARYPTFQWRDAHGREFSRTSNVRSSLGPRPGTLVPVLYDPEAPHRGVIDSFVQRGTIFTVIGVLMLGVAVFVGALGAMAANAS